jgi:hypothetical protein
MVAAENGTLDALIPVNVTIPSALEWTSLPPVPFV